ncbi:MAG: histidinol-phosphate transaminase [Dehalococcoidia bacterium]|nr:histidinol-phosphate transaminase [Dehalococcoidia bacterium]MDP6782122.1 histidinol-phosphate transaminase [Dehalococcoidia bacterium]
MPLKPKPWIANAMPAPHGGPLAAEMEALGLSPEDVVDFSVNINPFGPPPGVREAVATAAMERYPDAEATGLRRLLASRLGVGTDNLMAGNGATELIRLAAQCYLGPGDTAIIPQPAFGEYEVACSLAGARVLKPWGREEAGFLPDVTVLVDMVRRNRSHVLFLGNPANPAGSYLDWGAIETLLDADPCCLVAVDEAFISFVEAAWPSPEFVRYPNLVLLRSMTKDYSLAGLRLGYTVASAPVTAVLRRGCPPWNVNAAALAAGEAALKEDGFLKDSMRRVREVKELLAAGLSGLGLTPVISPAPFIIVKVGDAARVRRSLLQQGILVRDCASFGLPDYIRLGPRPVADCRRLIKALAQVMRASHA